MRTTVRFSAPASFAVLLLLASCVSPPDPPMFLAVDHTVAPVPNKGHVVRLEFFTRAQMDSPEWEFRRLTEATMVGCDGMARPIHREVRWFEPTAHSGEACARVVYTIRCLPRDRPPDVSQWRSPDDFSEMRRKLLGEVPSEIDPGCGREQDASKLANVRED
jgi:hypothetical protein